MRLVRELSLHMWWKFLIGHLPLGTRPMQLLNSVNFHLSIPMNISDMYKQGVLGIRLQHTELQACLFDKVGHTKGRKNNSRRKVFPSYKWWGGETTRTYISENPPHSLFAGMSLPWIYIRSKQSVRVIWAQDRAHIQTQHTKKPLNRNPYLFFISFLSA